MPFFSDGFYPAALEAARRENAIGYDETAWDFRMHTVMRQAKKDGQSLTFKRHFFQVNVLYIGVKIC
jgi:hypothetical protein